MGSWKQMDKQISLINISDYRMLKEPVLPLGEDFKGKTDEKNLEENAFFSIHQRTAKIQIFQWKL